MPALFLLLFVFGWFQPPTAHNPPPRTKVVPFDKAAQWLWTQAEWTPQGDAPLRAWREQLEARYTSVDIPAAVVEQYKQQYLQSPAQRKLFEWGYATYLLHRRDPAQTRDLQLLNVLAKTKPPYSYEFMRMRYLAEVAQGFQNDQMTALGERLAKADPKDYSIRYYLSASLRPDVPESRRKALAYAHEMTQIDPNRAIGYASLASIYYNIWIISGAKDTDAGRQAVQGYEEYLKRETRPTKASDKKMVQEIIDHLNGYIAKAEKGKAKN